MDNRNISWNWWARVLTILFLVMTGYRPGKLFLPFGYGVSGSASNLPGYMTERKSTEVR